MSRLVVVSNRIAPPDEHAASAGGVVKQGMRISR